MFSLHFLKTLHNFFHIMYLEYSLHRFLFTEMTVLNMDFITLSCFFIVYKRSHFFEDVVVILQSLMAKSVTLWLFTSLYLTYYRKFFAIFNLLTEFFAYRWIITILVKCSFIITTHFWLKSSGSKNNEVSYTKTWQANENHFCVRLLRHLLWY